MPSVGPKRIACQRQVVDGYDRCGPLGVLFGQVPYVVVAMTPVSRGSEMSTLARKMGTYGADAGNYGSNGTIRTASPNGSG